MGPFTELFLLAKKVHLSVRSFLLSFLMSTALVFLLSTLFCVVDVCGINVGCSIADAGPANDGNPQKNDSVKGEIIVKFKPTASTKTMDSITKSSGDKTVEEVKSSKIRRIKLSESDSISEAIQQYENVDDVEYAEPNYIRKALTVPNDEHWSKQWALTSINIPEAWDITTGSNVLVAVLDTGIDYTHEDLAGKCTGGYDFVNGDDDPMDDHWHGTHVAGTIAAVSNNGTGIAGVSWGARLMGLKVLDENGSGYDFDVAQAIEYAADNGARIINLSLGGSSYSSTLAEAVKYAQDRGCVIVAAAGNDNVNTPTYPAAYPNVIGVSATGFSGTKADYSNFGRYVDVAAPGGDSDGNTDHMILSCDIGGYAYAAGTSMATPHVAGLAALIASQYQSLSGFELTRAVLHATDDIGESGRDDLYGYGIINAQSAVANDFRFIEEVSALVTFSGTWSSENLGYASGSSYKYSDSVGDSATFTFYGTGFSWIANTGMSYGKARIYIDNVYQGDSNKVDLYDEKSDYQKIVYAKTGLSSGNHTVKVVVDGTKNVSSSGYSINIDAFDVVGELPAPAPEIVATTGNILNISWDDLSEEYAVDHYRVNKSSTGTTSAADINETKYTYTATPDIEYSISVAACSSSCDLAQSDTIMAVLSEDKAVTTPALDNVYVSAYSTAGQPPCTVFFESVTGSGETSISEATSTAEELSGAALIGKYFGIKTTASFAGDVKVALPYNDDGLSYEDELSLRVYKYESGEWSNCTAAIDTVKNIITAAATAPSLLAVGNPNDPAASINDNSDDNDDEENNSNGGGGGGGRSPKIPNRLEETEPETETVERIPVTIYMADVPESFWAHDYISELVKKGIVSGYADGSFRPSASVTRAEFAKIICLAMNWEIKHISQESFSDVPSQYWANPYIETAKSNKIFSGYPDGSFKPNKEVTRAEIAKILAGALNLKESKALKAPFSDVGKHWACRYIIECSGAGIVSGYSGNRFVPDATASRAEAAKMIALSFMPLI